jgi:NDP-sugar pyrophosphorylase family protein
VVHTVIDSPPDTAGFSAAVDQFRPRTMTLEYLSSPAAEEGTQHAVRRLLLATEGAACLLSTVDTVAPRQSYLELRRVAESIDEVALMILTTKTIHDDSPVWVELDDDEETVVGFGKRLAPTGQCFGNVRWFSPDGAQAYLRTPLQPSLRDSETTGIVVEHLVGRVHHLSVDPVFDIDTPEDLELASRWWSQGEAR